MLLHVMRNLADPDNKNAVAQAVARLAEILPPGWAVDRIGPQALEPLDERLTLRSPDGRQAIIALLVRRRIDPKDVPRVVETATASWEGAWMAVASYLSPATRDRLRERQVSYMDQTGNIRLAVSEPGLFIEKDGANQDPDREERPARSLRGPKAGRIVRILAERRTPPGVREMAALSGTDAGYVSRVLSLLDQEALIQRGLRGRIESVDVPSLLRRWADEVPLKERASTSTYLDPRGIAALTARLDKVPPSTLYAITGTLAAALYAPLTPARLATIWASDPKGFADTLDLRSTEAGANVLLLQPPDPSVYEGAREYEGRRYAAPAQVYADLYSSPGRGPAEAQELMDWMLAHEDEWRL